MKTIKKQKKKTIETSLEANLMKEPMSALFFLQLIEVDMWFFWPELKTQAKSLFDFFSNKLIWFFLWLVSPGFCFFCFWSTKNKLWGTHTNYNQFRSPKICFLFIKNTKKNPGDTSHKKNQISLFEKKIE